MNKKKLLHLVYKDFVLLISMYRPCQFPMNSCEIFRDYNLVITKIS